MADFAKSPLSREQLVLFPQKLDQIIPPGHTVRLLDEILGQLDWSAWTQQYDLTRGQPPIHPRVLAGVVLYGILCRIRTSRGLEEALLVRSDFRWLAEGRTIDHTTLSKFRQEHPVELKDLFVRIGLLARELGHLPLATLGFDGTRLRANNRRSGTRTPEELRLAKVELEARFAELEAQTAAADASDNERLGTDTEHQLATELADVTRRRQRVTAALAELARLEAAGQALPKRLPITDPESRVTPNKEGGFAPNYTPLATVDIDSGLIVAVDVLAHTDEDKHLLAAIAEVQESFGLEQPPGEMLADGLMSSGENLAKCAEAGIDLYSPIKLGVENNPAVRPDPSVPVAATDLERLPTTTTKHKDGTQTTKFNKDAFAYDAERDCYWCPAGKPLPYSHTTSEERNGQRRQRARYVANETDCAGCPLAARCLSGQAQARTTGHEQNEAHRVAHAKKMASPEAKQKYARRRSPGERPFAVIKQHFGARRFLTRGLTKVRREWTWLASAFNLQRLMSLIRSGAGPVRSGAGPVRSGAGPPAPAALA